MGQEAAGTLVAVHPSVKNVHLRIGLKVAAYTGGSYSEYVKVSADKIAVSSALRYLSPRRDERRSEER